MRYFNTSHVSINQGSQVCFSGWNKISIHLMFLLIVQAILDLIENYDFNTSHVSINHLQVLRSIVDPIYFNTSHVSINPDEVMLWRDIEPLFQYISCFY